MAGARPLWDDDEAPPPAVADRNASLGFERLHALVRGGYKPQIGTATVDTSIVLDHRGKAPRLRLFPDGSIRVLERNWPVHAEGDGDPFLIRAEDEISYRKLARFIENLAGRRRGKWRRRLFPF
ncbi:hypothetical protein [Sphingosinicella terrae]|jgi:hypothetical protein|uniref:hypothetical protein n=1 Tax=Sphingosinicella terrae TaxID=2172047 RepID=UPI000E0DCEE8|nr:hypothetical protein [Sphingosinicella terrae]